MGLFSLVVSSSQEFPVIFDCILVIAFEKFGMSGCGVGERYPLSQTLCYPTLGGTTCPRPPEAKLKPGVFALPPPMGLWLLEAAVLLQVQPSLGV